MAESSNNQPSNTPHTPHTPPAAGHHGQEEEAVDPLAGLDQSGRELLAEAGRLFQEYSPEPGALDALPQIRVAPQYIVDVCRVAKVDPGLDCKLLLCLSCVDYQEYLQLVYFLHSLAHEHTLVIKTDVPYNNPNLPSVSSVWQAADWYEREAHDLFGVVFEGHPNLSPLLLYDEFEGYPGRKEYPFYEYQEF